MTLNKSDKTNNDPGHLVLGIESSCDETAASVVLDGRQIVSSVIASQVEDHAPYGGVVPELASRRHLQNLLPTVKLALEQAGLGLDDISGIAVTQGPGLLGALLVGFSWAKALAWGRGVPIVGVSHLQGHLCSLSLSETPPPYPHLSLLVSGGHTSIYLVKSAIESQELGRTVDDAAGEAFDKVAKMLGLGYPGGVEIDRLAKQGDPRAYKFPRPRLKDGSFDFSFSGLKTALWTFCQKHADYNINDVCASFQEAVVDTLCGKLLAVAEHTGIRHLTLAGGVACNSRLRQALLERGQRQSIQVTLPAPSLCTDNAAMIAAAGAARLRAGYRLNLAADAISRLPRGGDLPN